MKRMIRAASRRSSLFDKGYTKLVDSGYADNKADYEYYKKKYADKGCELLRVKTDTPGLIMFEVYAKE